MAQQGMRLQVLFDFTAEESSELSVRADDVVTLVDAANAERDGWILVEDSRGTAGFIPADYARPSRATGNSIESASATTVATPAPPPAAAPAAVTASPTTFAQLSPPTVYPSQSATRLSSPATATTVADVPITSSGGGGGDGSRLSVLDPLAIARMTAPLAAGSYSGGTDYASARGAGVPPSSSAASDEYAHLFAAHEEWFKSAMTKRQEAYRSLQSESMDIVRAVAEAESRAKGALQHLAELESIISEERTKWATRLSEDAAAPMTGFGR